MPETAASEGAAGANRAEASHRPTRRRWRRRFRVAVSTLSVLVLIGVGGSYAFLVTRYSQVKKLTIHDLTVSAPSQPMNILLVGDNSRCVLNGTQARSFGTCSEVGGGRSDVVMVLHLNPATQTASLMSIPRDLWMPIPGTDGEQRIDYELNFGPQRLVETVQDDLGISINHYVELNFDSFQAVVNALGGVDMYFPVPVRDYYSGLDVQQTGCVHLDGFQSLALVRARHMYYKENGTWLYDGTGDLGRIIRDHLFLRVLFRTVVSKGLGNPLTADAVLSAMVKQIQVDSGLTFNTVLSLVNRYRSVNPDSIPAQTMPVVIDPTNYLYSGVGYGDIVLPAAPFDSQTISTLLGRTTPLGSALSPAGISVTVVDASGQPGTGAKVAAGLRQLGYQVSRGPDQASPVTAGETSETVVRYAPGHRQQAERVLENLNGVAILGEAPTGSADVEVVAGTNVAVVATPAPTRPVTTPATPTASPSTAASTPAASGTPSTTATGAVAPSSDVPLPSPATLNQPAVPAFDPRACPAGAIVRNL